MNLSEVQGQEGGRPQDQDRDGGDYQIAARQPSALLDRQILARIAKAWSRRIVKGRPKAESNSAMPPLGAASTLGA
ncbi:MAG: hypothetical protein WA740_07120 [Candidatus Binataceae bacterium]